MLNGPSQRIIADQTDSHTYDSSAGRGQNIGKEPPDLAPEDQFPIEAKEIVEGCILGSHRKEIHQGIADGDI